MPRCVWLLGCLCETLELQIVYNRRSGFKRLKGIVLVSRVLQGRAAKADLRQFRITRHDFGMGED